MDSEDADQKNPNNPLNQIFSILQSENPKAKDDTNEKEIDKTDDVSNSANNSLLPKEINHLFDGLANNSNTTDNDKETDQKTDENHETEKNTNFNDTIPCDFETSDDDEGKEKDEDSNNNDNQEETENSKDSDLNDDFIDAAEEKDKNSTNEDKPNTNITLETIEISTKLLIEASDNIQANKETDQDKSTKIDENDKEVKSTKIDENDKEDKSMKIDETDKEDKSTKIDETDKEDKSMKIDENDIEDKSIEIDKIDKEESMTSQTPWSNEVNDTNPEMISDSFADSNHPNKNESIQNETNNKTADSSLIQTEEINFVYDENDLPESIPQPTKNNPNLQSTLLTSSTTLESEKDDQLKTDSISNQLLTPITLNLDSIEDHPTNNSATKHSSRSSNTYSPKPEPFHVPPFDQKQFDLATQRSSRLSPEMQQFKKMILGEPTRPRTALYKKQPRTVIASSPYSRNEIISMANNLAAGKSTTIEDPGTVADVIDELTNIRLESMEKKDYVQTTQIGSVITNLRHSYREQDRLAFYKEKVNELTNRMNSAQDSLQQKKDTWKEKEKAEMQQFQDELKAMDNEHAQQLQKLEDDWKNEKSQRRFNRRSPFLLNQLQIEKNMLLTGDYLDAQHIRTLNQQFEKREAQERYTNMVWDFEEARKKLLNDQKQQIQTLRKSQEIRHKLFQRKMNQDLDLAKKTISNIQFKLNEEGNYDNFCAIKFKKSSDVVLPMTVTTDGGNDIPTAGKVRLTCGDNGDMQRFRQLNTFPPLSLPTLKASKIKHRPKAIVTTKKKK